MGVVGASGDGGGAAGGRSGRATRRSGGGGHHTHLTRRTKNEEAEDRRQRREKEGAPRAWVGVRWRGVMGWAKRRESRACGFWYVCLKLVGWVGGGVGEVGDEGLYYLQ